MVDKGGGLDVQFWASGLGIELMLRVRGWDLGCGGLEILGVFSLVHERSKCRSFLQCTRAKREHAILYPVSGLYIYI